MSGSTEIPDLSNLDLDAGQVAELLGVSRDEVALADATIALVERHAALITAMREQRGLTRAELARLLDLSPGRVTQLESGEIRHAVNLKTLAEIAHKLEFDIGVTARDRNEVIVVGESLAQEDSFSALRVRTVAVPLAQVAAGEVAGMHDMEAATFVLDDTNFQLRPDAGETFVLQTVTIEEAVTVTEDEEGDTAASHG